ncbi:hypothetical protein VNO80_03009 [Phaseolus coccineus]|uniref:Uncharacterized protein n=1 Tax=Phaseolus coccineus TaxID=3886 RepID=A0AAN9RNA0_PHACN
MPRAMTMPACLSRPGDARMPLAPWRCPHASRPGDARMLRALAMPACLSRPGDWSAERVWESTYDLRSEATVQSPCNAPQFLSLKCNDRTLPYTLLLPPLSAEERMRVSVWRALSSPMFPVSSPSIRHSLLGHYLTTTTTTTTAPTPMRKPNPSSLNPGLHSPPIHTQPHWPH